MVETRFSCKMNESELGVFFSDFMDQFGLEGLVSREAIPGMISLAAWEDSNRAYLVSCNLPEGRVLISSEPYDEGLERKMAEYTSNFISS